MKTPSDLCLYQNVSSSDFASARNSHSLRSSGSLSLNHFHKLSVIYSCSPSPNKSLLHNVLVVSLLQFIYSVSIYQTNTIYRLVVRVLRLHYKVNSSVIRDYYMAQLVNEVELRYFISTTLAQQTLYDLLIVSRICIIET